MKEYIWEDSDDGYVSTRKQELVRCKDCKYGRIYYGDHVACDIIEYPSHGLDWFCADGERR